MTAPRRCLPGRADDLPRNPPGGFVRTLQLATPPPAARQAAADRVFSRIVLAIDFGPASLGAARWATAHVAARADAVLMHVTPRNDKLSCADAHRGAGDEALGGATRALAGGLGGFAATLDVSSTREIVHFGRPSSCLAAVTNEMEASLLVLGRRAAANRVRVGEPNVIERVTRRTTASVLVVPEGTTCAPDQVVAAVDESRFAPLVLRVANRLARLCEVPLTVLHVLSPVMGAYDRIIRTAKQLGGAHHVTGPDSTELATGDPAREIVRVATHSDGAIVVMGMRGADEAPAGSIGSVARELLTRAPVAVLAVNTV